MRELSRSHHLQQPQKPEQPQHDQAARSAPHIDPRQGNEHFYQSRDLRPESAVESLWGCVLGKQKAPQVSQGMEAEFERLQLEYTSPQTRDSIRESASSLCSDFSRRSSLRSSVLSNSSVSNSNADGDGDAPLLRFLSR